MNQSGYTSASTFPWKLLRYSERIAQAGIVPLHLQLSPTNRCNGGCGFCSCAAVDRTLELPLGELVQLLTHFHHQGTQAVTLTGGGDPSVHPDFGEILQTAADLGLRLGVTSNGLALRAADLEILNRTATWLRVSIIPRLTVRQVQRLMERLLEALPNVTVSASVTVNEHTSLAVAEWLCRRSAADPRLSHLRFVQDLITLPTAPMAALEQQCRPLTDRAIFQWRNQPTLGVKDCLVSRLKPLVGADGQVYPCCGVQYARGPSRDLTPDFRMGHWSEFGPETPAFDGRRCTVCYYGGYNEALGHLVQPVPHQEFI